MSLLPDPAKKPRPLVVSLSGMTTPVVLPKMRLPASAAGVSRFTPIVPLWMSLFEMTPVKRLSRLKVIALRTAAGAAREGRGGGGGVHPKSLPVIVPVELALLSNDSARLLVIVTFDAPAPAMMNGPAMLLLLMIALAVPP